MSKQNVGTLSSAKTRERIFLCCVWILPIFLFFLLYVYVNFNTILLSFKTMHSEEDLSDYSWAGFANFKSFIDDVFNDPQLKYCLGNSMIIFGVTILFNLPLHVLVSYFLYKKVFGANIFKILLFLPNIISITVWVMMFRYFAEYAIPYLFEMVGLESVQVLDKSTVIGFWTMIFFHSWMGFAGGMLIFLGSMSRVPKSLSEAAQLDGIGIMQELWYIFIPLIYPVLTVTIITAVPGIFTNSLHTYTFFAETAGIRLYTFGYYLYIQIIGKTTASVTQYSYASAGGLLITLFVAPLTMFVRWLLNKFDPEVSY